MITDEKDGIKIAENQREVLITQTIDNMEKRNIQAELELEINKVLIDYLKKQKA